MSINLSEDPKEILTLGDRTRGNEIVASQEQAKFITIEVRRLSHCIGQAKSLRDGECPGASGKGRRRCVTTI
jgi:hypothetical protein